jgi:uncharacterized damage-inducible protein DinB
MTQPHPIHPPRSGPEDEMLHAFLDHFRAVMVRKVEGVDEEGLRWSPVDSGTCLGGLIKHLAYVERWWFQAVWRSDPVEFPWSEDDPDAEFRLDVHDTADSLIAFYRQECEISRRLTRDADLEDTIPWRDGRMSLRWIMVHMIEETARHCGHADIVREMLDGQVGD